MFGATPDGERRVGPAVALRRRVDGLVLVERAHLERVPARREPAVLLRVLAVLPVELARAVEAALELELLERRVSSEPMNVKLALRLLLGSLGRSSSCVSGSPGGTKPPSVQTMPEHCCGSTLPAAMLPPPSMLPGSTYMPQPSFMWAVLRDDRVAGAGHVDAVASRCPSRSCGRSSVPRPAGATASIAMPSPSLASAAFSTTALSSDAPSTEMPTPVVALAKFASIRLPLESRELDAALVEAQVVAAHDRAVGAVERRAPRPPPARPTLSTTRAVLDSTTWMPPSPAVTVLRSIRVACEQQRDVDAAGVRAERRCAAACCRSSPRARCPTPPEATTLLSSIRLALESREPDAVAEVAGDGVAAHDRCRLPPSRTMPVAVGRR